MATTPTPSINLPGLTSLPPMDFGSSASSSLSSAGSRYSASGAGDWTVNLSGSGPSMQAAAGGSNTVLILAAAAAVFLLLRRK